jgi:hypothetical protein
VEAFNMIRWFCIANRLLPALFTLGLAGVCLPTAFAETAPRFSWQEPHARVLPTGDLQWTPRPFRFERGSSVRYIDFENGRDSNDGASKATPWQHHPWDRNAPGRSAACQGLHTYCFKGGVVYRGSLVARESGKPGDPNDSVIEAARDPILIDIRDKRHIEISGLDMRYANPVDPTWAARPPLGRPYAATIHLLGDCSHINVHHCHIGHVGYGITAMPDSDGDVLDHITVADCDIHDVDGSGIFFNLQHHWLLTRRAIVRLVHVNVLRNRLANVGSRVVEPKAQGRDTINIRQGEIVEVADDVFDSLPFGVGPFRSCPGCRPVLRERSATKILGAEPYSVPCRQGAATRVAARGPLVFSVRSG